MLNFDVKTYVTNLRATKPPYKCPVPDCGKVYKSYAGIQHHLLNYDHDNPDPNVTAGKRPGPKKGRKSWHKGARTRSPSPPEFLRNTARETPLSYAEAQRIVEIDLDGRIHRINIFEQLEIVPQEEVDNCDNQEKESKPERSLSGKASSKQSSKNDAGKKDNSTSAAGTQAVSKLPEASFKVLSDYAKPSKVPARPTSYIRYMEKTPDELDDEVEYDMDEEVNSTRNNINKKKLLFHQFLICGSTQSNAKQPQELGEKAENLGHHRHS